MRNRPLYIPILFVAAFITGVALIGQRTVNAAASANTTANSLALIIRGITISSDRNLDFGEASQGTAAKTILPADATSARFLVGGEGAHAYTVTLPASATMLRVGGTGGVAADEIAVASFASTPTGVGGLLSGSAGGAGTQTVTVGAARAAIPEGQNPGSYTTSFSVTVAYP